jgi:rubrerythrin
MATLWKHYTLKKLEEQFGGGTVEVIHGLRCSNCHTDFHMDKTPQYCPACGESFIGEAKFGVRLNEQVIAKTASHG